MSMRGLFVRVLLVLFVVLGSSSVVGQQTTAVPTSASSGEAPDALGKV